MPIALDTTNVPSTAAPALRLDHLRALEAESIHVLREVSRNSNGR